MKYLKPKARKGTSAHVRAVQVHRNRKLDNDSIEALREAKLAEREWRDEMIRKKNQ